MKKHFIFLETGMNLKKVRQIINIKYFPVNLQIKFINRARQIQIFGITRR